jgi:hypothetical protein
MKKKIKNTKGNVRLMVSTGCLEIIDNQLSPVHMLMMFFKPLYITDTNFYDDL